MKIKLSMIYAARMMGYFTKSGEPLIKCEELVKAAKCSYQYSLKILNMLKNGGMIVSEQGCKGGYRAARNAEEISVYDIVKIFEVEDNRCETRGMSQDLYDDPFHIYLKNDMEIQMERWKFVKLKDLYSKSEM